MKQDIFIGVDGGGTKTKVLIEDRSGNLIGEAIGGAANIRLSVTQAWDSINNAINLALQNSEIDINSSDYNFHIGLGLAGVSIKKAVDEFLQTPHNFDKIVLESDAHIACLGAHEGKDGSIISIGTGVIGYRINKGHNYRVSGWGFPHADTGGGAWLGMEAIRYTFSWLDGCIDESKMVSSIYEHFNSDLMGLVAWANSSNSTQFGTIAPFVIKALQKNDKYAIELIKRAAKEVELLYIGLKNKIHTDQNIECHLLGGISPFLYPYVKSQKHIVLCNPKISAVKGAVYMIRDYCNKTLNSER